MGLCALVGRANKGQIALQHESVDDKITKKRDSRFLLKDLIEQYYIFDSLKLESPY